MSGNVWEWTDACMSTNGANDFCRIQGGSYSSNQGFGLFCGSDVTGASSRGTTRVDVGFRCCY